MVGISPVDNTAVQKAGEFVREICASGVPLKTAYLFGSYAKGTPGTWSDIDIALVSDVFIGVSFEDIKRFIDVTIKTPYMLFEIHTFNAKDFEAGDSFVQEIKQTGIRIL
ncbi:MAG: nucleotidyltransferase domain-containing protein [Saprospiraceae bacterium]|nr:nucleotidyltransferase domain-containing protein [Saprospiraceae bacterium]